MNLRNIQEDIASAMGKTTENMQTIYAIRGIVQGTH